MTTRPQFENDYASIPLATNRRHKDTVFRDLFGSPERKDNALSLYNALNGSRYANPDDLELTTIDNALYMSVKNDVSFLIEEHMVLWEHQSTYNPNMPLRGLSYFDHLYTSWVRRLDRSIYGHELIRLPNPHYTVFYIGREDRPEREEMRLSDAFAVKDGGGDLEVVANVININAGKNPSLMSGCKALADYSRLVELIRMYDRSMGINAAIDAAVNQCISEGVLEDYLKSRRAEVFDMFLTEYDEAETMRQLREEAIRDGQAIGFERGQAEGFEKGQAEGFEKGQAEGRAEGHAEGLSEGRAEGRAEEHAALLSKIAAMIKSGVLSIEDAASGLGIPQDELESALEE